MSTKNRAILRVYSETLRVDDISSLINAVPSKAIRKGDPISRQSKNSKTHEDSICFFDAETSDPMGLDKCVETLLEILENSKVLALNESCDLRMDIICYLAVIPGRLINSCCLEHELITRLSRLPIHLIINAVPE
ncbi:DUF4279 domain-containing protein [Bremerella sp. T1]|uniref:DUF4279 domain-containing protein n=1 Tax=Bremerella sp. TYQ1 TaxID=3119568 RepID=UPI001CCD6693|nr:DUF4279 domain-containing protein [Bremerella volcania]